MLSCKEITHLLSEAQDRKITLSERVNLEMHLAICKGCKNFKNQMSFLREACQRYVKNQEKVDD
jgi:predicted DNA-binding ribbon-helix-helix protein